MGATVELAEVEERELDGVRPALVVAASGRGCDWWQARITLNHPHFAR